MVIVRRKSTGCIARDSAFLAQNAGFSSPVLTDGLLNFVDYGLIGSKLADSGRRSRIISNDYIPDALKTGRDMCSGARKIEKYKHLLPI
jgi:hypothetical protein